MGDATIDFPMDVLNLGADATRLDMTHNAGRQLENRSASKLPMEAGRTPPESATTFSEAVAKMVKVMNEVIVVNLMESTPYAKQIFNFREVDVVTQTSENMIIMPDPVPNAMTSFTLPRVNRHYEVTVPSAYRWDGGAFRYDMRLIDLPRRAEFFRAQFRRMDNQMIISSELAMMAAIRFSGSRFNQILVQRSTIANDLMDAFNILFSVFGCFNRDPIEGITTCVALGKRHVIMGDASIGVMSERCITRVFRNNYMTHFSESGPGALGRLKEIPNIKEFTWGTDFKVYPAQGRELDDGASPYNPLRNTIEVGAHVLIPGVVDRCPNGSRYDTNCLHSAQVISHGIGVFSWSTLRCGELIDGDQYYPRGRLNTAVLQTIADSYETMLSNRNLQFYKDPMTGAPVVDPFIAHDAEGKPYVIEYLGEANFYSLTPDAVMHYAIVGGKELQNRCKPAARSEDPATVAQEMFDILDRNANQPLTAGVLSPIEAMAVMIAAINGRAPTVNENGAPVLGDEVVRNNYGCHDLPLLGANRSLIGLPGVTMPYDSIPGYSNAACIPYLASLADSTSAIGASWRRFVEYQKIFDTAKNFMTVFGPLWTAAGSMYKRDSNRVFDVSTLLDANKPDRASVLLQSRYAFLQNILPLRLPIAVLTDVIARARGPHVFGTFGDDVFNSALERGIHERMYQKNFNANRNVPADVVLSKAIAKNVEKLSESAPPDLDTSVAFAMAHTADVERYLNSAATRTMSSDEKFSLEAAIYAKMIVSPKGEGNPAGDVYIAGIAEQARRTMEVYPFREWVQEIAFKQLVHDRESQNEDSGAFDRDYVVVNLSVSRDVWRNTYHPDSLIQPVSLANPKSEMRRVSGRRPDADDVRAIRLMGRAHQAYSTPYDYKSSVAASLYDVAEPDAAYADQSIGPMGYQSSNNYTIRLNSIPEHLDIFTRIAYLCLLGTNVSTTDVYKAAASNNIPVTRDYLTIWPRVAMEVDDMIITRAGAGEVEYTKPNMRAVAQSNLEGTVFTDWQLNAIVKPRQAAVLPAVNIVHIFGGKNTSIIPAGNTKDSRQDDLEYDGFDITTMYDAAAGRGTCLVLGVGFGGVAVPNTLPLTGNMPVNITNVSLSPVEQERLAHLYPGMLFFDAITGASQTVFDDQLDTFTAMFQRSDRNNARPGLFTNPAATKIYNPVTGCYEMAQCGSGFFSNEAKMAETFTS